MDKSEHNTLSDFANITIPKEFYENDAEIILLHAELSGGDSILHNRKISSSACFISDEEEKY